jgi:carbon-monoxide dehydrogenase small subunit
VKVSFLLNGDQVSVEADANQPLSAILRNHYGLKGTHVGCRYGRCGACLVLLEDRLVPSCLVPAFRLEDARVTTIEAFSDSDDAEDVRTGFTRAGAVPCDFCRSGRYLSVHAALEESLSPSEAEIRDLFAVANCTCMTYPSFRDALRVAAELRQRRNHGRR